MDKSSSAAGIFIAIAAGAVALAINAISRGSSRRYARIDDQSLETVLGGGMELRYRVDSYREDGTRKSAAFKVGRMLDEGTVLCLVIQPLRGVVAWEETPLEELPPSVRRQLFKP